MTSTFSTEVQAMLSAGALSILAILIGFARSMVLQVLARQSVIGAVERAAGMAILEATAAPQNTLALLTSAESTIRTKAEEYVIDAVPAQLDRLGTAPVLPDMILGEIGKQMARAGMLPAAPAPGPGGRRDLPGLP